MSHRTVPGRALALGIALALAGTVAAAPPASNPLLTRAPAALEPAQVKQLQGLAADYGQLRFYQRANAALPQAGPGEQRVVFFGDSITQGWGEHDSSAFFPGKGYLNRGISGQTTAQMLVRFRQDVIDLKPAAVVILAGTNDIAGNTGAVTPAQIAANLQSMADLARAHGIAVVLCSVLPVSDYPWQPGIAPAQTVVDLNAMLRRYADAEGLTYVDYHAAMRNARGGLDAALAADGVHPTASGYALMAPLAEAGLKQALRPR